MQDLPSDGEVFLIDDVSHRGEPVCPPRKEGLENRQATMNRLAICIIRGGKHGEFTTQIRRIYNANTANLHHKHGEFIMQTRRICKATISP